MGWITLALGAAKAVAGAVSSVADWKKNREIRDAGRASAERDAMEGQVEQIERGRRARDGIDAPTRRRLREQYRADDQ